MPPAFWMFVFFKDLFSLFVGECLDNWDDFIRCQKVWLLSDIHFFFPKHPVGPGLCSPVRKWFWSRDEHFVATCAPDRAQKTNIAPEKLGSLKRGFPNWMPFWVSKNGARWFDFLQSPIGIWCMQILYVHITQLYFTFCNGVTVDERTPVWLIERGYLKSGEKLQLKWAPLIIHSKGDWHDLTIWISLGPVC